MKSIVEDRGNQDRTYDDFRNACRIYLEPLIHRYLIANTDGRWTGAEKAQRHREMCRFYVAVRHGMVGPEAISVGNPEYVQVHTVTQILTDHLDEVIGFPLVGQPDYDRLAVQFFERFHDLALQALTGCGGLK